MADRVGIRAVALLATHNEELFVQACLEHLLAEGLEVYLLDNASTDATVEIAGSYLGRGLIAIEDLPRSGVYSWEPILRRKQELAASLEADWFLHVDADEIRLPPSPGMTLAQALDEADRAGYNAVNFQEFTFVPTLEEPDHEHGRFQETMRFYYPFLKSFPHRLNAWRRQAETVDLVTGGGHRVAFPGLRMDPRSFPMRHYLFLSLDHAARKYVRRRYDPREVAAGWHRARASLELESIRLPSEKQLRRYRSDAELDASDPLDHHPVFVDGRRDRPDPASHEPAPR
jgi:hypothetical protein